MKHACEIILRLNPLQKSSINQIRSNSKNCCVIDRLTYSSKFVLVAVLKVFEELTSCLILFKCQFEHLSFARVLLHASTQ